MRLTTLNDSSLSLVVLRLVMSAVLYGKEPCPPSVSVTFRGSACVERPGFAVSARRTPRALFQKLRLGALLGERRRYSLVPHDQPRARVPPEQRIVVSRRPDGFRP